MCNISISTPLDRGGRGGSDPPPGWGSFVSARAWRFERKPESASATIKRRLLAIEVLPLRQEGCFEAERSHRENYMPYNIYIYPHLHSRETALEWALCQAGRPD